MGILAALIDGSELLVGPDALENEDRENLSTTRDRLEFVRTSAGRISGRIPFAEVIRSFSGLRATPDTGDFIIRESEHAPGFIDVAGIESPGLTAAPAIARYVGGDKAEILSLATGKEDSHHIAAKPSYMMSVRKADLWIRMGMELEIGYEPLVLDGSRNTKIRVGSPGHLDTSKGVLRLEVPTTKVDRSMGDIHPQGNPHYLLDPLNGRIVAKTIAQRMAQLAPQHAAYFTERLKDFRQELDERMFGQALVARIGGRPARALQVVDDTTLVGVTPPGEEGAADVILLAFHDSETARHEAWAAGADDLMAKANVTEGLLKPEARSPRPQRFRRSQFLAAISRLGTTP